jgi:hypothetical protein
MAIKNRGRGNCVFFAAGSYVRILQQKDIRLFAGSYPDYILYMQHQLYIKKTIIMCCILNP